MLNDFKVQVFMHFLYQSVLFFLLPSLVKAVSDFFRQCVFGDSKWIETKFCMSVRWLFSPNGFSTNSLEKVQETTTWTNKDIA